MELSVKQFSRIFFLYKIFSKDNDLNSVIDKCTNERSRHKRDLSAVKKILKEGMYM